MACLPRFIQLKALRGIGESKFAHETEEITIKSIAGDLNLLLNHLNWNDVDICGTSMGGMLHPPLSEVMIIIIIGQESLSNNSSFFRTTIARH